MKLIYQTHSRIPTEKAHGYQICKTCEALGKLNVEVSLWHSYRKQPPTLKNISPFEYYTIYQDLFDIRTIPALDLNGYAFLPEFVRDRFFPYQVATGFVASIGPVLRAYQSDKDLSLFTRDFITVSGWHLIGQFIQVPPITLEAHILPRPRMAPHFRRASKSLHSLVVITHHLKQRFVEEFDIPPEKIYVAPDAVDLDAFQIEESQTHCRKQLGLPLDRPIVGYVGRFEVMGKEKGIPELVESFKHLSRFSKTPPLLLCVGGPISSETRYRKIAKDHGIPQSAIKFVDRVPNAEVPRWLKACDLLTIPWPWTEFSAYFTSPLKLFEYMGSGVPIISSDLPSIQEILVHGENGYLVEPGNPEALGAAIKHLLENKTLAKRMGAQAQQEAKNYTWQKRAEILIDALCRKTC